MKLAIMQPYLFPYLGYFQLIRAVDAFVVFDDVNYINRGWINRNNILSQGEPRRFTLELVGASQNKLINGIEVTGRDNKLLKSIRQSYGKAPYFSEVFSLIEGVFQHPEKNLARRLDFQLRQVCSYLGLKPQWYISSELKKDSALRGQEKILAICHELGGSHYINMPGGKELYDREIFAASGIQLSFLQPNPVTYQQFGVFVPNLSIIDVMMFNSQEQCTKLLEEYELV